MKQKPDCYYINFLGMWAKGKTRAEAKENAEKQIRAALTADYSPILLTKPGFEQYSIIVYRQPEGYAYRFTQRGATVILGDVTTDEARAAAAYHLEQITWEPSSPDDFPLLADFPAKAKELKKWADWQRDYTRLKLLGHDDSYCFENAKG